MGTIVVGSDGSAAARSAADVAAELARATGDELLVVAAYMPVAGSFGTPMPEMLGGGLLDAEREAAQAAIDAAMARAAAAGVPARGELRLGSPAAEICAVAESAGARLIAVGAHGWGAFRSALLGSVTVAVIHRAPCPVLAVKAPEEAEEQNEAPPAEDG
jgi:nucleotide-binding universal stress UspA family protein